MLVGALLLTLSLPAVAADPCKGLRVERDRFGGGANMDFPIYSGKAFALTEQTETVRFQLQSGTPVLVVAVHRPGDVNGILAAGTTASLLLEDGQVLTVATKRDAPTTSAVTTTPPYVVYTEYTFPLYLDVTTIEQLASRNVTALRVPLPSGNVDIDLPKTGQKGVKYASTCAQSLAPATPTATSGGPAAEPALPTPAPDATTPAKKAN